MEHILAFSVRRRWLVLLMTLAATISGAWSLTKLPIDAVPDVTNVQVQVNAVAPSLSPIEIEKQVTFPIETALAGTPGLESTRSFSRNGFAQITAVFTDRTDIYFARQQVAERVTEAKANLPPGVEVKMGPISTGLGEIYWWSVEYTPPGEGVAVRDGKPGWQSDGAYLTPEGERLTDDFQRTVYLRTVQDWIIRPQMKSVPGVAGADAIGGYVKQYQVQPDPARLIAHGLSFEPNREGDRSQQCQPRRELYRAQRRGLRRARQRPRRDPRGNRGHRRCHAWRGAGTHQRHCRGYTGTRTPNRERKRERT